MHGERLRCSSLCFFLEALSYLVGLFLSLPRFIKIAFYGSFHSEQSYEYIHVYPSLRTKSVVSSCTFGFDLDFSPGAHDVKGHPCEIHETSDDNIAIAPNLVSPFLQAGTRHYNYLPYSMIFPQNITSTSPNLMENPNTSLLKNIYKPLNISLTFLK